MRNIYIYALVDPRDDTIRYIGKTIQSLEKRMKSHLRRRDGTRRARWIEELSASQQKPSIHILEVIRANKDWEKRERWWIAHGMDEGWPLTNVSDGGEGRAPGHYKSSITRKRQSDAMKAAWARGAYRSRDTEEWRKKISIAKKGTVIFPEHRAKISRANKGKKCNEKLKRYLSETRRGEDGPMFGRKHSPETIAEYRTLRKGEANSNAKLTTEKVLEIRRRHASGEGSYASLAKDHSVSKSTIAHVVKRLIWASI